MQQQEEDKSYIRWGFHPDNSKPIIEVYIKKEDNKKNLFSEILFDLIPMLQESEPDLHANRIGYRATSWCVYEINSWHNNVHDRIEEIVKELNERYLKDEQM